MSGRSEKSIPSPEGAAVLAVSPWPTDRLRLRDARLGGGRPLSGSIGIATYPDDVSAKDELLDKAD